MPSVSQHLASAPSSIIFFRQCCSDARSPVCPGERSQLLSSDLMQHPEESLPQEAISAYYLRFI